MKNLRLTQFLALLIVSLFISNCLLAQANESSSLDKLKLSVSKLIINNNDITDSLGIVKISDKIWTEFDRTGKEIGRANIVKNKDNEIHIKWISATNGATKDGVTIYKIVKKDNFYTFDIYFNDQKQGYFVASSQ